MTYDCEGEGEYMLDFDEAIDPTVTAARQRYLEPGTSLRISDLTDALGGYACSVVDVDDDHIWIDLPIRRDHMLDLAPGQLVAARFDRPGDAVYLFDTVVAEVRQDDRAPFALAMPVAINRRPHRQHARVSMVVDASYEGEGISGEGKVVDLSAGGLGLICADELAEGTELLVRCSLPGPDDELQLEQPAVICTVSMYGRTPAGTTLHHYGLKFAADDDELHERILTSVIWNLTRNPEVL